MHLALSAETLNSLLAGRAASSLSSETLSTLLTTFVFPFVHTLSGYNHNCDVSSRHPGWCVLYVAVQWTGICVYYL